MAKKISYISFFLFLFTILISRPSISEEYYWNDYREPITYVTVYHNESVNIHLDLPQEYLNGKDKITLIVSVESRSGSTKNIKFRAEFASFNPVIKVNDYFWGTYNINTTANPSFQTHEIKIKTKYLKAGKNVLKAIFRWKENTHYCSGKGCCYIIRSMFFKDMDVASAKEVVLEDGVSVLSTSKPDIIASFPKMNVGDSWVLTTRTGIVRATVASVDSKGGFKVLVKSGEKGISSSYYITQSEKFLQKIHSSYAINFPIYLGKKWNLQFTGKSVKSGLTRDYINKYVVQKYEKIVTKAGSFEAIKIEGKQSVVGSNRESPFTLWYSPDAKIPVKSEYSWMAGEELISYNLAAESKETLVKNIKDVKLDEASKIELSQKEDGNERVNTISAKLKEEQQLKKRLEKELEDRKEQERVLKSKLESILNNPPNILVFTPKNNAKVADDTIMIHGIVQDNRGVSDLKFAVNDKACEEQKDRGLVIARKRFPKTYEFSQQIQLEKGENVISIYAVNANELSSEKKVTIFHEDISEQIVNKAFLIGVNDYDSWSDLINPLFDVESLGKEIEQYYGFDVRLLKNPTKASAMSMLRKYAQASYGDQEQLLIWFSGHGFFDEVSKIGYLVAKDTLSPESDNTFNSFIDYPKLMQTISNIPCKHIFLVVDACFAGTLDSRIAIRSKDIYTEITKEEYIQRKLEYKTRLYLTSGGKQYVPDGRPGAHSPFTRKFLSALRSYGGKDGILTFEEIVALYMDKVKPQPRYNEFLGNEPGSSFVFITR